jgi:hypothetical protein
MLSPWPADLHGEQLCNPATLQHPDFRTGSFGDNPARSWRFCFAAESSIHWRFWSGLPRKYLKKC